MRNAAIASVLVVALAVVGVAGAAETPKRTTLAAITGKISVLKLKTITVKKTSAHSTGKLTCRVTTTSPKLSGFALGASARITCVSGVLATIKKLPTAAAATTKPITPSQSSPGVVEDGTINANPDKSNVGTTTIKPGGSVVGTSMITALSGTSVTFGGSITCTLNATSPSTAAFKVGSDVDYQCASSVLTKLSVAFD